jgi:hypothetical protein
MTGTWHVIAWRRQALAAVSHADQSWIIASIVSRRTGRRSHLACGTGLHRIRTVPAQGRYACVGVCGLYLAFCAVWAGARTASRRRCGY